jgi:hypothetical protein
VSLEASGLRIALAPLANEAIATARIVCDFEPGMATVPFKRDFPAINCIVGGILTDSVQLVVIKNNPPIS